MADYESWTDSLPQSTQSGIGIVTNAKYSGGIMRQTHDFMHKCLNLSENGKQFYGIFCAYNGDQRAAKYISNRLAFEIFFDNPITVEMTPEQILETLQLKFATVTTLYDQDVNELLVRRLLQKEQSTEESRKVVANINAKLRAGSTALVAVVVADHIYVINCGNSRALALDIDNGLVMQLNTEHDWDNQDELQRLPQARVSTENFVRPTRGVGDCFRGICYKENDELAGALGPPLICTPDVYVYPVGFDEHNCSQQLLLCSDSVVSVIEEIGIEPKNVNQFLVSELNREKENIQKNRTEQKTKSSISLASLAQATLDSITRQHRESAGPLYNSQHDDMSIVLASISEITCFAVRRTMSIDDNTNSFSLEDTQDSEDSNDPHPYVDCGDFEERQHAAEITAEIELLFKKMAKHRQRFHQGRASEQR